MDYSPFSTLKRFLNELFLRSGYLAALGAGLLLTAAFPKFGVAGFAWIVPGLLLAIAQGKSRGTPSASVTSQDWRIFCRRCAGCC